MLIIWMDGAFSVCETLGAVGRKAEPVDRTGPMHRLFQGVSFLWRRGQHQTPIEQKQGLHQHVAGVLIDFFYQYDLAAIGREGPFATQHQLLAKLLP